MTNSNSIAEKFLAGFCTLSIPSLEELSSNVAELLKKQGNMAEPELMNYCQAILTGITAIRPKFWQGMFDAQLMLKTGVSLREVDSALFGNTKRFKPLPTSVPEKEKERYKFVLTFLEFVEPLFNPSSDPDRKMLEIHKTMGIFPGNTVSATLVDSVQEILRKARDWPPAYQIEASRILREKGSLGLKDAQTTFRAGTRRFAEGA